MINSENNTSAKQTLVLKSEICKVVISCIPKTFTCYTHSLAFDFSDNWLNYNFVLGYGMRFKLGSNLVYNVFRPYFRLVVVVAFTFKYSLDHIFNNASYFAWIEPLNKQIFLTFRALWVLICKCFHGWAFKRIPFFNNI